MQDDYIFKFSTKKNFLIFITAFFIFIGIRLDNRILILFGFFFLFILIAASIYSAFMFKGLSALREHYPRCFEGNKVNINLLIRTTSEFPHYMLEIADTFPPGSDFRIKNLVPYSFNDESLFSIQYKGKCSRRRGIYILGPIQLTCYDPMGIFKSEITIEHYTNLLVYPQAVDLKYFEVLWQGTIFHVGIETLLKSGKSEEFTGLRDYQRGDNPRLIHWRSSARHQKLLIKDFRENTQTDVSVFLDLFRLSFTGVGDITTVEYIIKAAATVARTAIEQGHFVQIFKMSDEPEHIQLGGGTQHLITILDRMTFFRHKGEGSFDKIFRQQSTLCRNGSTVVLIVSAANFNHADIKDVLHILSERKIKLIVILIDDRTFIKIYSEQEKMHADAAPIEDIARLLILEGCAVYIIGRNDDLKEKLSMENELVASLF